MSPQQARALALAYELHGVLGDLHDLPQHGRGSRVERAWDLTDDVISTLEDEPEALRVVCVRGREAST